MILTKDRLREAAKLAKTERVYEGFALTESFRYDGLDTYDLFISHSFNDKDLVVGLRYLFSDAEHWGLGVRYYGCNKQNNCINYYSLCMN